MSQKSLALGFAMVAISTAFAGQAFAGANCNTGYSFPPRSVAYAKPITKPAPVIVSRQASKPTPSRIAAAPQSGGDSEPAVRAPRKVVAQVAQAPQVPQVPSQKQALPEPQPAPQQQAEAPVETKIEDSTSVSAVAARLAALAAQQAAAARKAGAAAQ